ncbi:MAG: hypothetical protein OEW18_00880, partial [Candidatus Aminicenantes bacterium]|nr:hypothetical protein [Candidatus Aminicenantes bacterium]
MEPPEPVAQPGMSADSPEESSLRLKPGEPDSRAGLIAHLLEKSHPSAGAAPAIPTGRRMGVQKSLSGKLSARAGWRI